MERPDVSREHELRDAAALATFVHENTDTPLAVVVVLAMELRRPGQGDTAAIFSHTVAAFGIARARAIFNAASSLAFPADPAGHRR